MPGRVSHGVNASHPETPIPLATDAAGRLLVALANPVSGNISVEVTSSEDVSHTVEGSVTVIDHWDYKAHSGKLYSASWLFPNVANGAEAVLFIRPKLDHFVHSKIAVASGGAFRVAINEDPTVTSAGTALAAFNMHRAYSGQAATLIRRTPTVINVGMQLYITQGGAGNKEPGATSFAEWALCHNHTYLIRGINEAGAPQDMSVEIVFTEEPCPV